MLIGSARIILALLTATCCAGSTFAEEPSSVSVDNENPCGAQRTTCGEAANPGVAARPTNISLLVDPKGNRIGVMFRFAVEDIEDVVDNRVRAERLLPDAIRYAESLGLPTIAIQAYQVTSTVGSFSSFRNYGYVWRKDPNSGAWLFYVKATL